MRLLPLSGVGFVGCFGAAAALYGSGAGKGAAEIAAYYGDPANSMRQIEGFAALLAGCVLLLVYVAVVARELVPDEPLATVAIASGAGCVVLLAAGNALWAASALSTEIEGGYRLGAAAHLAAEDAGFGLVVAAMALAIPFVVAATIAVARTRSLPAWFAALGLPAVAGLAAAYWYLPLAAFLVWIVCGSVLLARARRPAAA